MTRTLLPKIALQYITSYDNVSSPQNTLADVIKATCDIASLVLEL